MKSKHRKEFWALVNKELNNKPPKLNIPLNVLYDHFKKSSGIKVEPYQPKSYNVSEDYLPDWNPNGINNVISLEEVKYALKSAKSNKACGTDGIINEFLKSSPEGLLKLYVSVFNLVLFSGIVPEDWTTGIIKPVFKNKGNKSNPENYRGIRILSCLGKIFTAILNNRIVTHIENSCILGEEQAGFRAGYSVSDHTFVLKSIIDLYLYKHKSYIVHSLITEQRTIK